MEKMSRRKFLKIGSAACAGVGLAAVTKTASAAKEGAIMKPGDNRQKAKNWGMVIDMNKLTEENYKACVEACHSFHNVPNIDTKKDEVKWIWKEKFENLFLDETNERLAEKYRGKEFIAICNHCEEPVCVRVCPTKATFQNEQGIVEMDMHRCIGCRNCMAACPYGSRSFNFKDPRDYLDEINPAYPTRMKGVVEKCNFCEDRLAKGQLPLCVELSGGAITFGDIDDPESGVSKVLAENFTLQRRANLGTKPKVFYIV